jgi:GR25 family glycosyltransferase involved in LPS biosynthesis
MKPEGFKTAKDNFVARGFEANKIHSFKAVNGKDKNLQNTMKGNTQMLTPRAENQIMGTIGRESHSSLPGWGAVGCYLSHFNLWLKAVNEGKTLFIAEEDAHIDDPDAKQHIADSFHNFMRAKDNHMLSMGYLFDTGNEAPTDDNVRGLRRVTGRIYGLQGYIITPKGAQILVAKAFPIEVQVDSYIGYMIENGGVGDTGYEHFGLYVTETPIILQQNNEGTRIQTKEVSNEYYGGIMPMECSQEFLIGVAILSCVLGFVVGHYVIARR